MKLSIVTINLNNKEGLLQTRDSIDAQSFKDFEWIVIDGASTDGSRKVLEEAGDLVDLAVSEPDNGIYAAMNKGIQLAHGEYIHFLNSGDYYTDGNVLDALFAGQEVNGDLYYGDFNKRGKNGKLKRVHQEEYLGISSFFHKGLCHQTVFFKRALFTRFGLFDERLQVASDWEFMVRALMGNATSQYIPVPVVYYEGDGVSVTLEEQSASEKRGFLQNLPPAVYHDCVDRLALQEECRRLRETENWLSSIQDRNLVVNYAMVTLWYLRKLSRFWRR